MMTPYPRLILVCALLAASGAAHADPLALCAHLSEHATEFNAADAQLCEGELAALLEDLSPEAQQAMGDCVLALTPVDAPAFYACYDQAAGVTRERASFFSKRAEVQKLEVVMAEEASESKKAHRIRVHQTFPIPEPDPCQSLKVRPVIKKKGKAFRKCYQTILISEPTYSGKVVLEWEIQTDGRVEGAGVKSSTMPNDAIDACLLEHVERMRFPAPESRTCKVVYPIIFNPQN